MAKKPIPMPKIIKSNEKQNAKTMQQSKMAGNIKILRKASLNEATGKVTPAVIKQTKKGKAVEKKAIAMMEKDPMQLMKNNRKNNVDFRKPAATAKRKING